MAIWFKEFNLEDLANRNQRTLVDHLDIKFTEIGDDYLVATMPFSENTQQYMGILHGGASCVLAETVGSVAANFVIDQEKYRAVGQEINANHIRPVSSGLVTGKVKPVHLGRTTQVWDIQITNNQGKLTCISRLTMAVVNLDKIKNI